MRATQARSAEHDDEAGEQLLKTESDALLAWLTIQPMAGVIATLKHATRGPYEDIDYANPAERAQYSGDVLEAGEQFRR